MDEREYSTANIFHKVTHRKAYHGAICVEAKTIYRPELF